MIKDVELLKKFENDFLKNTPISYIDALKIFEALWHEAETLKVLPGEDIMEGIDIKIKIAKILNSCSKNS
ncbi:MAG: hypothetical protein M1409_04370 [Actinobacteria bacterium]|nr:hypothetical protein [Actinomycetota bacterium]